VPPASESGRHMHVVPESKMPAMDAAPALSERTGSPPRVMLATGTA
jgi:hypothetical protein